MEQEMIKKHMAKEPNTFILIGQSGAGKGTQGRLLKKFLEEIDPSRAVIHLDMGDRFRTWIPHLPDYRKNKIKADQEAGKLQSYRQAVYLWRNYFEETLRTGDEHIIMDGSPRTVEEAKELIGAFTDDFSRNPVVIPLTVSDELAFARIVGRNNEDGVPRQETASEESIKNKLQYYHTDVVPAINTIPEKYFVKNWEATKHGKDFSFEGIAINASPQDKQVVFQSILQAIGATLWRRRLQQGRDQKIFFGQKVNEAEWASLGIFPVESEKLLNEAKDALTV